MPVFTDLSPQQQQGTSLGDLVNLARGVQAYQQAQQLNPVQLQTAQQQLLRLQQLTPEEVSKAQSEATLAKETLKPRIEEQVSKTAQAQTAQQKAALEFDTAQQSVLFNIAGGVLNDLQKNPQNSIQTLEQAKARAMNAIKSDPKAKEKLDETFEPLMKVAKTQPQALPQVIKNIIESNIGAIQQQALQTGSTVELNGVKYYYNPSTRQLEQLGGAPAQPTQPGQAATQAVRKPSLIVEDMPVTGGNVSQLTSQQKDRYDSGVKLIDESVKAGVNAQESKQSIRKINEFINKAAGSAPGQALRKAGKWMFGDSEVEMLMKNLADQQLRTANAMGVPTNMARETSDLASGSADITPKALKSVIDRSDAMNTALDEFRSGLKKYVDNAGALNGPIHANKFQQAWADNYDVRIFLAKNILDSNMSADEKEKARQAILSRMTQKEIKELQEKSNNIEMLMKGGFK
jgi:hypothetical protein